MEHETIGKLAVEWHKAEKSKRMARAAFMAAHSAAVEEHGYTCSADGPCMAAFKGLCTGHGCVTRDLVHAASRQQYDAFQAAKKAARAARTRMAGKINRGFFVEERAAMAQQAINEKQTDMFSGVSNA